VAVADGLGVSAVEGKVREDFGPIVAKEPHEWLIKRLLSRWAVQGSNLRPWD